MRVASPEPAIGVFTPAGTCPGRLRRHCVIGCADPGQNPPAASSRSSRVRGRGLGRTMARPVPWSRPGSGDDGWGAEARRGHDRRRRGGAWRGWRTRTWCRSPGMAAAEGREGWELQINSLFCKPICKPDAARQLETGETEPTERDGIGPVRRGHHARERLPGTAETNVVWLITQRSRVQIPPPLPRPEALSRTEKGPSASGLCTDLCTGTCSTSTLACIVLEASSSAHELLTCIQARFKRPGGLG